MEVLSYPLSPSDGRSYRSPLFDRRKQPDIFAKLEEPQSWRMTGNLLLKELE